MVLKKKRPTSDVLIIDASRGFEKSGKNNRLRACDIKKIVETVKNRKDVEKYAAVVSKDTIRENEYNLNITRYVDSADDPERWDIRSTMFGGIPEVEVEELHDYWHAFPGLRDALFTETSEGYVKVKVNSVADLIQSFPSVIDYKNKFAATFDGLKDILKEDLIDGVLDVEVDKEKEKITQDIFDRVDHLELLDRYMAYQVFDDCWNVISADIEMLQTEGFEVINQVDPIMVVKKDKTNDDGDVVEVQDGWRGHILPFDLVQQEYLPDELNEITRINDRLSEIKDSYSEIIDSFEEDEKQGKFLNDDNDAFVSKELKATADDILKDVTSREIEALTKYLGLTKKKKLTFVTECNDVSWESLEIGKDGTYKKASINARIQELKLLYEFPEDSFEYKIIRAYKMMDEEIQLKGELKTKTEELQEKTKKMIETLPEDKCLLIVEHKWIKPLINGLFSMPDHAVLDTVKKVEHLSEKYEITIHDLQDKKVNVKRQLVDMLEGIKGQSADMEGLSEFRKILKG